MYQGLAASTLRTRSCAQQKLINFCVMIGHVSSSGSPCLATEWTLCLFATFLADSLRTLLLRCIYLWYALFMWIKVSLTHWRTAFRFKELLEESSVHRALNLLTHVYQFDDHMFWAACLLVYFGFLRSAEFTVPSLSVFDPNRHLSVHDIAVYVPLNPSCLQICIKTSKTDPFRKRCNILIGAWFSFVRSSSNCLLP